MKELISITQADRRFFRLGLIGGITLLTFFTLQSIGGKFGDRMTETWGMILLILVPISVTVVVLQFSKTSNREVNRSFFRLIYGFYAFYLLAIFAVWIYQPFIGTPASLEDGIATAPGLYDALVKASYALLPMQIILIGLIVGFNFRKGTAPVISPVVTDTATDDTVLVNEQLKTKIKPLHNELMADLMEGDIGDYFEKFNAFCLENDFQIDHIAIIQNRWRRNRKDRLAGTISTEEYDRGNAKTLQALIHFMDELG